MSIFQMRYTVQYHDGKELAGIDMLAFIKSEGGCYNFKERAGTRFNTRRISSQEYFDYKFHRRRYFGHTTERVGSFGTFDTMYYISNCSYIVIDGLGRTVHPDVFVNAFLERYPVLDKNIRVDWYGRSSVYWNKTTNAWSVFEPAQRARRSFRKSGQWRNGRRHTTGAKERYTNMKRNRRPEFTDDGVRIPQVRIGEKDSCFIAGLLEWEHNHRFYEEERNWKSQRKTQYKVK